MCNLEFSHVGTLTSRPEKSISKVIFTGVLSTDIDQYWPFVAELIERGLGEGETLDQTYTRIVTRGTQLWIAQDAQSILAACCTEIVTKNEIKFCNIFACGGSRMNEWLQFITVVESWAKANGATVMRFCEIRNGWQRVLKNYTIKHITLEKAL